MKRFFLPSLLVVVSLLVGVGLLGQGRPVTAQMQEPSFSIDPNGPSVGPPPKFHPADILGNPGAPVVGIPCLALGLWGCGLAPPFDDLDALSYGADFTGLMDIGYVGFSVDTGSWGQPGTAVDYESGCTPPEPEADEFSTILDGNNSLVYDGDGIDCVTGAPVPSMGLVEVPQPPPSDDLDALDDHNYTFVDSDGNTIPDRYVYFSLQPGSLTLDMSPDGAVGGLTWSPADILVTIAGMRPNIYAGFGALGLVAGDDVDGLCLAEVAMDDYFDPIGGDVLFYTITPGSPSATPAGWIDPGDIMYVPTPGVAVVVDEAAALGLLDSDDLNAIKCVKGLVDISIETFTVTLPDGTVVNPGDDVTMNMKVSEWATLTVEESKHYVGEEPGELNPPQVWSQVWWAVLGADPSQLNVRWVPAPGDICTFDGEEVDCVDGDPATGDINDLEFEVLLPWCDPQTVTREVEVHCKASTEDPAEPFTITFENVEMPLGANDLDQSNNASYIDLTIACEYAPENPSFTVGESIIPTPSGANPGDILRLNGQKFAPPVVAIPCQNLGLNAVNCAAQLNDLNSLSYGAEPALPPEVIPDFKFSITEEIWPDGLPGTDVNLESTCMAAPGQAHGDEFDVDFPLPAPGVGGTNTQVLDENGIQDAAGCVVPPGYPVGTPLPGDDINGLVEQGADYVDTDGDTIPENPVYFTLDAGSADLAGIGTEADILMTQNGLAPVVWASAAQLGLVGGLGGPPNADEIDALCIYEDGDDVYNPLIDIVWLSLAPGSPTLGPLGATAADVLASRAGAVSIVHQADQLGLEHPSVTGSTDNLNAMKCWLHEPAMPTGTLRIEKYDQGGALVGGATFTINPDPADGVGPTITVTDGGAGDPDGMADGIISLTAVPTSYTVTETVPPPGCTMTGPNPQVAVVTAAATTIVSFSDICEVPPAHYKCYDMIGPGPAPGVTVDLETQFGVETGVQVLDPLWLCPPALKDGEGDLTDTHLKCYQIDSSDDPDVTVNLTTQFGVETDVEVGPAGSLCVPALKEVVFPAPEPPPPGPVPPAPHYKCYSILGHSPGAPVDLETQFGFEPGVTVYDAEALCVPALKDGLGDLNAPHLKCYYISPGDIPDHIVNLETQFGLELDVGVGEGRYLCVEAIKEIVEPVDAHYKCYDIYPQDAPPVPFVELETQFGTDLVEVGPNTELCAPAVKDGEGDLTDPHLKCYDIWGGDPDVVVNLTTQFGLEENVEVGPARLLCMGAAKQVTFPPPVCCECPMYPMCFDATTIDACVAAGCMPVPDAGCVDPDIGICEPLSPQPPADLHYECFDILATGHDPPDVVGLLQTQFGLEFDVDVGPAELLCAPAKKEGIGTLDAPHLKCYQIRLEYPGEYWVNLETQWGSEVDLQVGESRWLCAEATKEIVEPEVQDPTFSIARGGPSTPAPVDPADLVIRTLPGGVWPPTVVWPCGPGGFNWPNCGGPDDVNALSLGFDFVLPPPDPANPNAYMYFSVAPGSIGVLGTGVNNETVGCVPEPEADEFGSAGTGGNYQYFDGDGAASCANPGAPPLGLSEPPPAGGPSDDLDAVDPLNLNASGPPIFVTLEQNSPSLYIMPGVPLFSAADIVVDFGAGVAGWYATAPQLGLDSAGMNTDDIDALCINDADGDQVYTAGVDTVWFSLTAGSASLGANSPADVFAAPFTGKPARTAAQLGLLPTDELNALKCYEVPPCIDREGDTQCDDPVNDPDDDGCADVEEQVGAPPPAPGATGAYDPTAWYDFYDVPVPAKADTAGANGTRNKAVAMDDVLAVLFYVGTYAGDASDPPNANGVRYDTIKGVDLDGDTVNDIPPPLHQIKEGVKYDRSPSALPNPPWDAGPPSGAVAMDDVLAVLAQVGLSCIAAP